MPLNDDFDASKNYRGLDFNPDQFVAPKDFELLQDIINYDKSEMNKYFGGFQLYINSLLDAPVLKVKANYLLTESQHIEIEMIDATHAKWRKNGGAWSAGIVVTCDNATWNTLGTSGLDVVFRNTSAIADSSEIWVSQAIRLLGGSLEFVGAGSFKVNDGKWSLLGEFVDLPTQTAVGCVNNDFLCIKVEKALLPYTSDYTLGHRLADGAFDENSPSAEEATYTLEAHATIPANTSTPFVHYIIVGKIVDSVTGVLIQSWSESYDSQKIWRIFGDTTAPAVPTGFTISTGSDTPYVPTTIARVVSSIPLSGYLSMSCNQNSESDVQYYEFKITRLASVGGLVTTDSFSQLVYPNNDSGGGFIPTGVNFTIHGMTMGVPYRVWVRAVDFSGNVGDWSASSDTVIGGSSSLIGIAVPGPTFTLIDTPGFVGVTISVTGVPVGASGYSIWIGEGAYPNVAANEGFVGNYNADIGVVNVPWKENGRPYVRIKAYDQNGLYQTLYSQDNTSLEATAQVAATTHNESLASHGGAIGDLITSQGPYGSLYKWLTAISGQSWTPGGVYVLATSGSLYTTLESCFNAIQLSGTTRATIFVMPGGYGTGATYVIPSFPNVRVDIVGLGANVCYLADLLDLTNVGTSTLTSPPNITFTGITFVLDVIGNSGTGAIKVDFTDCSFRLGTTGSKIFTLTTSGAGSFNLRFNNCFFFGDAAGLVDFTGAVNFVFSDCYCVQLNASNPFLLLNTPTGTVRLLKNCAIQVPVGSTSYSINSSGVGIPYTVWAYGTAWNVAPPGARITVTPGSVTTNTVMPDGFLMY